jgi:alkanesulfonate monooxygenase SsuD/methylene tetrahydromethanopterin reductase-like flavin-dependent oxidoreductase (luciferase family)
MPVEMLLPPGYLSLKSMMGVMGAKREIGSGTLTIEEVMQKGMFLCGSPATLREKLEQYQKEIGFGYLLPTMQFGTLPHELVNKSTEIFAKEVIPYFRQRDAAKPARAAAGTR